MILILLHLQRILLYVVPPRILIRSFHHSNHRCMHPPTTRYWVGGRPADCLRPVATKEPYNEMLIRAAFFDFRLAILNLHSWVGFFNIAAPVGSKTRNPGQASAIGNS